MKLLVIDGNSIVNRAFFGIKMLSTRDGRFTNAIFGFMNILHGLLKTHQPDEVAIAWDLKAPTFRHKMYDGYKATRHGMPPELAQQLPVLKELLSDLGFVMISCEGWEADDLLGTLAAACEKRRDDCLLATGDRDSLQLVSESTTVLLATNRETIVMDEDAVREKYGVSPRQLIDVKSLMGDASDNIPGVAGIGEKTALKLVQAFGSLDGVYEHLDDPRIKQGQLVKLVAHQAEAELSRTLGTIRTDAPIPTDEGAYRRTAGDPAAAARLFADLEMHKMAVQFGVDGSASAPAAAGDAPLPQVSVQDAPAHFAGRVYLAADGQGWYAVQENLVCRLEGAALAALLDEPQAELWVFDAKPLFHLALAAGGQGRSIVFDGKLAAYLLNPSASGYTVPNLCAEYAAPAAFVCEELPDAARLPALCERLEAKIVELDMKHLLDDVELPLALVLADMERTGFLVDAKGIRQYGDAIQKDLDATLARIYEAVGYKFNVNSPKQLGKALFEDLQLPPRKKTRSGYSTDAATLESLRGYSPVVEDILQYRTYQKLVSTYVEGLLKVIGPDGRIHTNFLQTEARTGRLSSTEPNLQNIPIRTELGSHLREFFVAAPGCTLVDADYSQIELRILAAIADDESMKQAFLEGQDIHRSTAAKIYHIPPEEVTPRIRASAKAINFGIMYGKGAFSLSQDLGVSVKEAEAFLRDYLDAFPSIRGYMEGCIAQAKADGYVSTLLGRRRYLPELSSSNFQVRSSGERMARNTPIQGTAADVIKLAMVKVWRRLKAELPAARLILQVHDELLVEVPLADAAQAACILTEEMQGALKLSVPLTAQAHAGENWLLAH